VAVGFVYEQRMGEGEGMAQGFIGRAVSTRRKGSGGNQAGLAACHMRATAVAFHAWPCHRWLKKGKCQGKRKEAQGRRKERREKTLTGGDSAQ